MSQDQIQLPEPVGTVAPRPDVVDWFSYEPEIGTELHEAATVRRLIAEAVAAEREACAVAVKRLHEYELSAAIHHADTWHVAHEHHMKRASAVSDALAAIRARGDQS